MRWLACFLLPLLAATCGQKGPLTLPEEESSVAVAPFAALRSLAVAHDVPHEAPYETILVGRVRAGQVLVTVVQAGHVIPRS